MNDALREISGGYIKVIRAYIRVLGEKTGLFFCDLENRSRMEKTIWDDNGFFKCKREFLQHPDMILCYSEDTQKERLRILSRKQVVTVKLKGMPSCRWIRINWNVVLQLIEKWLTKPRILVGGKPPGKGVENPPAKKEENTYPVFSSNRREEGASAGADRPTPEERESVELSTLHKVALTKPSKKTTPSEFDKGIADYVRQFCLSISGVPSTQRKNWAEQVRLLRQSENGPDQKTITAVVTSYVTAYRKGITKFTVFHCGEMRRQWNILVKIAAKVPPPVSPRAIQIAEKSSLTAKWPKVVTAEQVAGFAQQVISFAEALLDKAMKERKRLEAKSPKTAADRVLIQALGTVAVRVGGADGYAKRHLEHVRDEVRKWKDWSGNLSMYVPSLTNKAGAFKRFALDSGISEETWTRVKEVLK